ncbi:FMN-binding protein [Candidatus Clostridium helianthi]|uniref:FMN-binding protein n=1 Tax=Candidatus Clostridium helianthi TaxID=3381660 RepID=A0ABW8S9G5_9CLOT
MASKIKKSQIIRHIIQLITFILLPGLYSMTFSEVKTVYQMIINGNFNFLEALPSLIEFIAIMLLTIVLGRWFCGWICAFGAYNDLVYFISKKVFKIKFRVDEKVDSILKYFKYVVLLFIIAISWTMGSSILESTSPWDVFGQITDVSTIFSSLLVGLIFLILITIGAAFIERFFCRYLCPLGAIFSIISKIGIVKINKPKADCGKCRACTMNCSMGLSLYKVDCVKGGDCINCLKCTEVCYRNNANVNVLGRDLDAKLTGSVAMAAFLGIYGLTNFAGNAVTKSGITAKSSAVSSNLNSQTESSQKYKDGTYTGIGQGYRGGQTEMSVTISNGKITKIETISNEDTPKFYQRAEGTITNSIISKQSTSVDTVSGATFSSKGIISAVKSALEQAAIGDLTNGISDNSNANKTEAAPESSKLNHETTSSNTVQNNASEYKDGTYTGSGTGYRGGTTKVSVTVSDGKISSIQAISNQDTPKFYQRAEGTIIKSIISKQSTSVDTVSGATYSSKGIMSAVTNALNGAK